LVWKDKKEFVTDLKAVYTAPNEQSAADALKRTEAKWARNTAMLCNPGETTGRI